MPQLVAAGEIDMAMGSSFMTLNMVQLGIKAVTVATMFQKDPQTRVAHAGQGVRTLEDLNGRPTMVRQFSPNEFWQFLKARYGFTDDQLRPLRKTRPSARRAASPKRAPSAYVSDGVPSAGCRSAR